MYINSKEFTLKSGQTVIIKSMDSFDGADFCRHMRKIIGETPFTSRYPEEFTLTDTDETQYICTVNNDADEFALAAFVGGRIVGSITVSRVAPKIKFLHRAVFGIAVEKAYWNIGIGSLLMEQMLENIKNTVFEKLELSVIASNHRAVQMYKKIGFETEGVIKNGVKFKDGTYSDEILMGYFIK